MKPNLISAVRTALMSAAVVLALVSCQNAGGKGAADSHLYQQIQSTGTLRAAYAVGAPLFVIDPNSKRKSGIFYDAVNEASTRLGLRVDWSQEIGYGEMVQGLRDRRYDIVGSGVWINSDRAKGADFTIPLFYDAVYAYARHGDSRFTNLAQFNSPKFTISTMDGELGVTIANRDFPRAKTLQLPQNAGFAQMILNVVNGKADVVFLAAAPARDYQAKNPGKLDILQPTKPIRIFPNAVMIPQGQYELRQALNYALGEMINDGTVDEILSKYEKDPRVLLRSSLPYRPQ